MPNNKKYIDYFQMSKYLTVYSLIVFIYTLMVEDKSGSFSVLSLDISTLNIISFFISISVFSGILHYILIVDSPHKEAIRRFLSPLRSRESVLFNIQFHFLIAPHLIFLLLFST